MRNTKGEGSFVRNTNGSYTHRKSVGYKLNGCRKVITVTAANKTACIREMKKKENEWLTSRNNGNSQDLTLEELCQAHLDYQVASQELKPKSIDRRECSIDNHIGKYSIADKLIKDIGVADIDDFISLLINEKRLSASSIIKVLDILNAAYDWGLLRKLAVINPVAPIKTTLRKRISKLKDKTANDTDVRVFSEDEEDIFVQEAMKKDHHGNYTYSAGLYLVFLLYTGLRVGEFLSLLWSDVDITNGMITICKCSTMVKNRNSLTGAKYVISTGTTKNEKARRIKLTEKAHEILIILWKNRGKNKLVCITNNDKPNTATNLEHRLTVICKNAGLAGISGLHTFRRTFATKLYSNGARTKEIAAYIGDLPSTTEHYYIGVRRKVLIGHDAIEVVPVPSAINNA